MNTVARAWQATMIALTEAGELHARGGDIETIRDLLRHARELIEIVEEEIAQESANSPIPMSFAWPPPSFATACRRPKRR
jgi:hypothetical protein